MSMTEIFWIFLMLSAIQPVLKQRLLDTSRARLFGRVEEKRGSRVISLVHRQETMSFLGFPVFRYIDIDDSEQVIRAIHLTGPEVPKMGLNVTTAIPEEFFQLMSLYAQPLRRRPSVEYLPTPHRAVPSRAGSKEA